MNPLLRPFAVFTLVLSFAGSAWSADAKEDASLQGAWTPSAAEMAGQAFPEKVRSSIKLVVEGDKYTVTIGKKVDKGTCKLDPAASPKQLDIMGEEGPNKGKTLLAIYERNGDTLRVCYDLSGKARPAAFETKPGTSLFLVTYQREKP